MPQYLLSVHGVGSDFDPAAGKFGAYSSQEDAESALADTSVFNEKLVAEGHFVFAGGLRSASTATVVDGRGDKPVYTDGPYLESKEYLGGFWVIEAPDLDVALRLAAEGSRACRGKVEVRPFQGLIEQG
ncbi:MAG TPA: YciI family protein [Acidimicrobiales bacterium]|nr:YciI family protein [Acidimicrobiales bacterium]